MASSQYFKTEEKHNVSEECSNAPSFDKFFSRYNKKKEELETFFQKYTTKNPKKSLYSNVDIPLVEVVQE